MKNTIKKLALFGCIGSIIAPSAFAREEDNPLIQGTIWATASTLCTAMGIGAGRVAFFKALRGTPSQPLTAIASSAFFIGAHCIVKTREEFRKAPLTNDKRTVTSHLIAGSTLFALPTGIQPIPVSNGFIGHWLKRIGTTTRVGIMACGAYTLAQANTSLWRHQ